MPNYNVLAYLSYTIGIAGIVGAIRFKSILKVYRPFIYLVWFATFNELLSTVLIYAFRNNAVSSNIYVLIESLLFIWFFYCIGKLQHRLVIYILLVILFISIWILDNFWMYTIYTTNSLFRVAYAFVLVLLSIDQINFVLIHEKGNLLKNARFLICAGTIIFYSFKTIFELFYMFKIKMSDSFYNHLFLILVFVNLITNLIYSLAVLWIPTKQKFTLPY